MGENRKTGWRWWRWREKVRGRRAAGTAWWGQRNTDVEVAGGREAWRRRDGIYAICIPIYSTTRDGCERDEARCAVGERERDRRKEREGEKVRQKAVDEQVRRCGKCGANGAVPDHCPIITGDLRFCQKK